MPSRLSASLASLALAAGSMLLPAAFPTVQAPAQAAPTSQATAEEPASDPQEDAAGESEEETAEAQSGSTQIVIEEVSPWVDAEGELTVSGRIVNGTGDVIRPESLTLSRSSGRMSIRDDVDGWVDRQPAPILLASADEPGGDSSGEPTDAEDEDGDEAPSLTVPELAGALAPGERTDFEFSVPADQMRPSGSAVGSWGALGLVVTLTGSSDAAGSEGDTDSGAGTDPEDLGADPAPEAGGFTLTAPAFTVWHPDPGVDPTILTTVLPVTLDSVPADGGPLIEPEVLERAADPSATGAYAGALGRTLSAARTLEDSVLAVDPRVIASARAALELPAEDPAEAEAAEAGQDTGTEDPGQQGSGTQDASERGSDQDGTGEGDSGQNDGGTPAPDSAETDTDDGEEADEAEPSPNPADAAERLPRLAEWYAEFTDLAADREVIALPWADAHLTGLRAAASAADPTASREAEDPEASAEEEAAAARTTGLEDLLDAAADDRTTTGGGPDTRMDIMWPAADTVRQTDLTALADRGASALILSDTQSPAITSYTSSANSTLSTDGDPPLGGGTDAPGVDSTDEEGAPEDGDGQRVLRTFVADSGLSRAAAGEAGGQPAAPGQALATSAAISAERPFDSRHLLLTLPRETAGADLPELARHLDAAPWLGSASLSGLADTEPVVRSSLVEPAAGSAADAGGDQAGAGSAQAGEAGEAEAAETEASRTADFLDPLGESYGHGSAGSAVFLEDAEARRDMARSLLICAGTRRVEAVRMGEGNAGTEDSGAEDADAADSGAGDAGSPDSGEATAQSCSSRTTGWVSSLAGGVRPEPGSSVLLVTGEQAMIPVHVENSTDREAHVRLRVEASTPQLSTQESDPIELGPQESRSVEVPVRGLANADVQARVRVLSLAGEPMPQSTDLLVRVRADWENTATIAVGSALALVLVFGLIKTIRRGRRKIPKNQLDAAVARAQD